MQLLENLVHLSEKPINESSVCSWVFVYKNELERKRRISEALPEVQVLPHCKRGCPLLLGEKLDCKVKAYIRMYSQYVKLLGLL